jgi:cobaltochelatase CobS
VTKKQHLFLTRNKELQACELIEESNYRRKIKFLEGENKDKVISIHPKGVAWGNMYPRLFEVTSKSAQHPFVFKGRVLLSKPKDHGNAAIPKENSGYRFQPFLSHVIDSINQNQAVLLSGGTGVGKTTHILQLAARINQPVLRINFNGETRMSDLIGKNQVINGETIWVDGVLPMAMRKGYWLLLDELDFADPAVLSLLHPVIEENPMLVLKENKGEVVEPHSEFRIFATANSIGAMQERASSYSGTNQMNEAFLDRWQVLLVQNLTEKEELKVVKQEAPGIKTRWAKKIVQFAQKVREKKLEENYEFSGDNFSTRKVLAWAKKTALLRSPVEGAKLAWLDKMNASEQEVILRILETNFGGKRTKKVKTVETKVKGKRGRPKKTV